MVMGSVAFIEERQKFNMGLGIPAGGISVLAAGEIIIRLTHLEDTSSSNKSFTKSQKVNWISSLETTYSSTSLK